MHKLKLYLFKLSRQQKRLLMLTMDCALLPLAIWLSYALRLETWTPDLKDGVWLMLLAPLLSIPVFARLGLYHAIIRFLGHQALNAVAKGVAFSAIVMIAATILLDLKDIPRSVFVIYFGTAFLLLGSVRHFIRRLFHSTNNQQQRVTIAIYGAGSSGAQLAQALFSSPEYRPVLFIDDNKTLQKSFVHGLKVHAPDELPTLIERYQLKQVLLALPSATPTDRRNILDMLEPLPVHIRSIPGMADLVAGKAVEEIHEISIDELLGRAAVTPEKELLERCIQHKNVVVTGAGGSIGSELCRQIIRLQPKKLVLFESSEFALYQIERELLAACENMQSPPAIIPVLGSVQNQARIEKVLKTHAIQTLYHAAAYKHVPLVEHNPIEGVQNNVLGTWRTACAADEVRVEHFVLISTDKAVRPTNVMGASKRMAELGLQALAKESRQTVFSMVRFGNVLGSSGSVVPLFRKQIKAGQTLTVTHPEITRYFMTIPEAAQLVIQAGAMAKGGEVFLLEMGQPVKILDLAQRMIRLSGLKEKTPQNPDGDIEIQFTGLRPGEKLYEELLIDESNAEETAHPRIFHAHEESITYTDYKKMLDLLVTACNQSNINTIHQILDTYVSGYQHIALANQKVVHLHTVHKTIPQTVTGH